MASDGYITHLLFLKGLPTSQLTVAVLARIGDFRGVKFVLENPAFHSSDQLTLVINDILSSDIAIIISQY